MLHVPSAPRVGRLCWIASKGCADGSASAHQLVAWLSAAVAKGKSTNLLPAHRDVLPPVPAARVEDLKRVVGAAGHPGLVALTGDADGVRWRGAACRRFVH